MLDRDALIRGMMEQNVPRWKAEKEADRLIAEASRQLEPSPFARRDPDYLPAVAAGVIRATPGFTRSEMDSDIRREMDRTGADHPPVIARAWPFRLTLPWSHLVSDNAKYCPAMRGAKPAIILTIEYRNAKRQAAIAARKAWGPATTYDGPLSLRAMVYFPHQRRKGDSINFSKCAHDALEGIVYDSDNQLEEIIWKRAGVDVDAPRAELTIHPILS